MKMKYIKPELEVVEVVNQPLCCTSTCGCNGNPYNCGTICDCHGSQDYEEDDYEVVNL